MMFRMPLAYLRCYPPRGLRKTQCRDWFCRSTLVCPFTRHQPRTMNIAIRRMRCSPFDFTVSLKRMLTGRTKSVPYRQQIAKIYALNELVFVAPVSSSCEREFLPAQETRRTRLIAAYPRQP